MPMYKILHFEEQGSQRLFEPLKIKSKSTLKLKSAASTISYTPIA